LREPAAGPVLECVDRYCQLRQGERFSQPHLESDYTATGRTRYRVAHHIRLRRRAARRHSSDWPKNLCTAQRRLSNQPVNEKRCLAPHRSCAASRTSWGTYNCSPPSRRTARPPMMTLWKCAIRNRLLANTNLTDESRIRKSALK